MQAVHSARSSTCRPQSGPSAQYTAHLERISGLLWRRRRLCRRCRPFAVVAFARLFSACAKRRLRCRHVLHQQPEGPQLLQRYVTGTSRSAARACVARVARPRSVQHHLLGSYLRAMMAVLAGQLHGKHVEGGTRGLLQLTRCGCKEGRGGAGRGGAGRAERGGEAALGPLACLPAHLLGDARAGRCG